MTIKSFTLAKKAPKFGVRHIQVLFLFSCGTLAFQQRMNLSVGIVAMTNANSTNPNYAEYQLTEQQKAYMLSSLFWGTVCTQLLSGYFSSRYGAKIIILVISLGTSLLSICLPYAMAFGGWRLLCALRLLQGLFQGCLWPSFYSHLAKWSPKEERNCLGGIMQTGLDLGTALGFAISGVLAASPLGWPSMFYVPGYLGIIWSLLWLVYGANSPEESKLISLAERKRLQLACEQEQNDGKRRPLPVPWCAILTSYPYLVLACCKISQASCFYTLMQQIPTYIHGVFHYNIQVNALLSAMPFFFMCAMSYVFLFVADYLTRRKSVSLVIVRKSINSIASWVPAIALLVLSYLSVENIAGSVTCLIIAVAAISGQSIGSSLNHIDLAPNYAGLLFGMSNTLMSVAGLVSPILVSLTVSNEGDRTQWRIVFIGISIILFVGNFLYLLFGQMSIQPWNATSQSKNVNQIAQEKTSIPSYDILTEKFTYTKYMKAQENNLEPMRANN